MTSEERSEAARNAITARWAELMPEERSAEMKRRARVRKRRREQAMKIPLRIRMVAWVYAKRVPGGLALREDDL
jgi:hypothetical protein